MNKCQCENPGACPRHADHPLATIRVKDEVLWHKCRTRPDYRCLWDIESGKECDMDVAKAEKIGANAVAWQCIHRGERSGLEPCPTCKGSIKIIKYDCAVHGTCQMQQYLKGVKPCSLCTDRQKFHSPTVRNLLYHVCPFKGNGVWQRNIEQLLERIDLFNGKRVVGIVTGGNCDPPQMVIDAFKGHVQDFIIERNNPKLREVVTFLPLWERVETDDPYQATFYGHSKGVTKPVNPGVTCHPWRDVMFETCLDYWPLVEKVLTQYPIAGSFKKIGAGFFSSHSAWHYSGTFYWVRNAELFKNRNWRNVDRMWWGNESWPGIIFHPVEAACLFWEAAVPQMNLYDFHYWYGTVMPAYAQWKEAHQHERTQRTLV